MVSAKPSMIAGENGVALPKGYQNAPPSPAVPLKPKPEEKPVPAQDTDAAAPAPNSRTNPNNPAGIVF